MRSKTPFPLQEYADLCQFLNVAWSKGWLDEYSDEHFLIKAIENDLTTFVGKEQMIENNIDMCGIVYNDGSINKKMFNINFCINFSLRMQSLLNVFGENNIKSFVKDQMSAGKQNYKEDVFFEALSEVSILSFYVRIYNWEQAIYEPPVCSDNNKNPEAKFIGKIHCKVDGKEEKKITINIEVKSPEFPHDKHEGERIAIPTVLLSDNGRKYVKRYCNDNNDVVHF